MTAAISDNEERCASNPFWLIKKCALDLILAVISIFIMTGWSVWKKMISHPISAPGKSLKSTTEGTPLHPICIRLCPSFRIDFLNKWKPWWSDRALTAKFGDAPYSESFTSKDSSYGENWRFPCWAISGWRTNAIATVKAQYSLLKESMTVLQIRDLVESKSEWWTTQKSPDKV